MKKFNSSDLSHKRTEVMTAARNGGAIIQTKRSNGEVVEEFALTPLTDDAHRITRGIR